MVGVTVLALVAVWFAFARPSGHPSARPSPGRNSAGISPLGSSPTAILTIAHVRVGGQSADLGVYRGPADSLCVRLTTEGELSCDLFPRPGETVRLAYANWLYLDSACCGFGMFVVGSIRPPVASVRVSLGAGRWVDAAILTPPSELEFPFRLFYMEKRTGFQSLNRRLSVIALDAQGQEIGRTTYLVQGG